MLDTYKSEKKIRLSSFNQDKNESFLYVWKIIPFLILILASCTTSRTIIDPSYSPSAVPAEDIVKLAPNYSQQLTSVKGKGRAIVSEPGNSDRATIAFETDSVLSVLTIKNRIGIEGGKMLVDEDSILIYNKIDKVAQKVSVRDGRLTSLNELASVNLLDLLNFKISENQVEKVFESETHFLLTLKNKGSATIHKKEQVVTSVKQHVSSGLPYSSINYESYGKVDGYTLPRKITIFSADGDSKVIFQIRSIDVNPESLNLNIDIPKGVTIQRI